MVNIKKNNIFLLRLLKFYFLLSIDLFSKFLEPNFNQVTFTSSILKSAPISDSLTKLNSGLTSLDKELNQQVSEHHEELLTQVNRIRELEEMLQVVTSGVDSLQNSLDRFLKYIENFLLNQVMKLNKLELRMKFLNPQNLSNQNANNWLIFKLLAIY